MDGGRSTWDRREALRVGTLASLLGIAGCTESSNNGQSGSVDGSENGPIDRSGNESTGDESESDPEADEPTLEPADGWQGVDPTGEITYRDDPNWRLLGHDTGSTFHNPHADGPSDDPQVRWTVQGINDPLAGFNHHPLIVDGTVYVIQERDGATSSSGSSDPEKNRGAQFVAVDAETGESETVFELDGRITRPTIVDDIVYAAVGGGVVAYDLQEERFRWRTDDVLVYPSSIRVVGDVLVALDQEQMYSYPEWEPLPQLFVLDAADGTILWEAAGDGGGGSQPRLPIIADGCTFYPDTPLVRSVDEMTPAAMLPMPIYYPVLRDGELYGSNEGGLVSIDWSTLKTRWEYRPEDRSIGGGWVAVFDDIVVVDDFRGPGFVGLDRATGDRRWATTIRENRIPAAYLASTSDRVYVAHQGGAASAIDPADGTVVWTLDEEGMEWGRADGCALADDLLVTVGRDGTYFAIS
ncbi:PQQ-binding-like beta-propeller repeat protein [Halovivax limisalsi]|uniref:outer membrane protein assembly factor BamB family protein n=1 Tax=Halovivax limisalsi TaxID=1453760 RepID=UPI001FFDD066|nr:PQQ-binding-like beta-propeller repeat protein [Halovivax limisalsi]